MKTNFVLLILTILPFMCFSQDNTSSQVDKIFLKTGEEVQCRISRVGPKNIFYYNAESFALEKIEKELVEKYEFNDEFFQTNDNERLEHAKVVIMEGYTRDEIYRGLQDWYFENTREILDGTYIEDEENAILMGLISSSTYFKLDFVNLMGLIQDIFGALGGTYYSSGSELREYYLNVNTQIRVKEGRFKIKVNDIEIHNTKDGYVKTLSDLYGVRRAKNGESTYSYLEIEKLKVLVNETIKEIRDHVEYVRINDTIRERAINSMLMDDDW